MSNTHETAKTHTDSFYFGEDELVGEVADTQFFDSDGVLIYEYLNVRIYDGEDDEISEYDFVKVWECDRISTIFPYVMSSEERENASWTWEKKSVVDKIYADDEVDLDSVHDKGVDSKSLASLFRAMADCIDAKCQHHEDVDDGEPREISSEGPSMEIPEAFPFTNKKRRDKLTRVLVDPKEVLDVEHARSLGMIPVIDLASMPLVYGVVRCESTLEMTVSFKPKTAGFGSWLRVLSNRQCDLFRPKTNQP